MSQMGQTGIKPSASSNIYTVLVAIAMLALIGGIVAVMLRSKELYGTTNPFDLTVDIKEPVKAKPAAPAPAEAAPTGGATGGTAPTTPVTPTTTTPPAN